MAAPEHLSYTAFDDEYAGVTSGATLATSVGTFLVACGWASEGAGVYKSPVSANGRFMKVLVEGASGYLRLTFSDDMSRTAPAVRINRTVTSTFNVWGGATYLVVQNTTENELCAGALVTVQPEGDGAHDNLLAVYGFRDTDGNATSATILMWSVYDLNAAAYTALTPQHCAIFETRTIGNGTAAPGKTVIGTRKELPLVVLGLDTASDYRKRGILPNMLLMAVAGGATVGMTVPINFTEGDSVNFRVTVATAGAGWRLAIKESA